MSKLILDINARVEAAADDRARGVIVRRLRRALEAHSDDWRAYWTAIQQIADKQHLRWFDGVTGVDDALPQRDGVHLNGTGHRFTDWRLAQKLAEESGGAVPNKENDYLRQLIAAKNRLWFHYTRPQNWAFLAGDRTEQPSSRDHKDPSKRWFPEEMKQWLPLIDAKEKEIWALAAKAAKDGSTKDAKNTK